MLCLQVEIRSPFVKCAEKEGGGDDAERLVAAEERDGYADEAIVRGETHSELSSVAQHFADSHQTRKTTGDGHGQNPDSRSIDTGRSRGRFTFSDCANFEPKSGSPQ